MKDRISALRGVALGAGLAILVSGAIVAAQVSTGPVKNVKVDPVQPCCAVVAIDAKSSTVTAKVTNTGQTFTLMDFPIAMRARLAVGDQLGFAMLATSPNEPQLETAQPCCVVVSTDIRAGTALVRVIKTGQTFAAPIAAQSLKGLKTGDRLNLVRITHK